MAYEQHHGVDADGVGQRVEDLKRVYRAIMSLDPTGQGRRRWTIRWKPALNAFDMTFDGRLSAARK